MTKVNNNKQFLMQPGDECTYQLNGKPADGIKTTKGKIYPGVITKVVLDHYTTARIMDDNNEECFVHEHHGSYLVGYTTVTTQVEQSVLIERTKEYFGKIKDALTTQYNEELAKIIENEEGTIKLIGNSK